MRSSLSLVRIVTTIVLVVAGLGWGWPTFFHDSCPLELIVHARTLYDRDGIQLQGTARIVTYKASVCRVSEQYQSEPEYEQMKSNHGRPLHVWQLDFSAYNGTGKSLAHLRADFEIESAWPPCTNWSGLSKYYPKSVKWAGGVQTLEKYNGVVPDEVLRGTAFLLVFHKQQPEFKNWSVDFSLADERSPPSSEIRSCSAKSVTEAQHPREEREATRKVEGEGHNGSISASRNDSRRVEEPVGTECLRPTSQKLESIGPSWSSDISDQESTRSFPQAECPAHGVESSEEGILENNPYSVVLTDGCSTLKSNSSMLKCSYTVTYSGEKGSLLSVGLQLPEGVDNWHGPDFDCSGEPCESCAVCFAGIDRRGPFVVYKFKINEEKSVFSFSTVASNENYGSENKSCYVELDGQHVAVTSGCEVEVPARKEKASFIRLAAGKGFARLFDDFVDFKEVDDRILIENDSRLRSEAMAGALFKLHEFPSGRTLDIAANVEFTQGRGKAIDGFFFGFGVGLTPAIELVFGYSLDRGTELSHGFRRAMGQFIMDHREDERFPEFQNIDLVDGVIENLKDYDGLPLTYRKGMNNSVRKNRGMDEIVRIFPGNPLTKSFNSKLSFGILIPLDIWKQIKSIASKGSE